MRKTILLLLTVILFNSSYSQINIGLKSGINITTTRDLIAFPRNRLAWHAGGFVTIALSDKFHLQPELLYSTKGNRSYNQIGDSKLVTRMNYINMPILLGWRIDNKTTFTSGIELGYLVSVHHIILSARENLNESKNYPSKFDAGIAIGIKHAFIKNMGVEVRYNYGLRTLYAVDALGNRYSNTKGANRVLNIGVYYLLK
jgi:hypothetical protein